MTNNQGWEEELIYEAPGLATEKEIRTLRKFIIGLLHQKRQEIEKALGDIKQPTPTNSNRLLAYNEGIEKSEEIITKILG